MSEILEYINTVYLQFLLYCFSIGEMVSLFHLVKFA